MSRPGILTWLVSLGCGLSVATSLLAQGTWSSLINTAPEPINTMLLLSDGSVMAAGVNSMNAWYRLSPDTSGSYVNGTWSALAPMHDSRLYYSSDVLTNGNVFVAGAEYGTGTNTAEVYDPVKNTWTRCPSPPVGQTLFYDSVSKILPDGNVLVAPVGPATSGGTVIYVTASNTWTTGGTLFRGSYQDEASWVKLPDDSILTIDPFGTQSERYIPSLNLWVGDANVPVMLYDPFGSELGAAFLLPDGRAFFLGATGNTALYTPSGNTNMGVWQAGPVIPNAQGTPDAPAAAMVNGNILCAVSPVPTSGNHFPSPTSFYEFDPSGNVFNQVSGPTGATFPGPSYVMRMLDLPDGTVLLAAESSQLYVYQPGGAALASGQPAIATIAQNPDGSFHAAGTLFTGISEGAAYGDDAQMGSNYPLVRLIDGGGTVYYTRTFGWTSTGVMTSNRTVSTEFNLPAGLPATDFSLELTANGNASAAVPFSIANLAPVIVAQPKSLTLAAGASATFSIAAAGTPLTYSWQRNGAPIAGATASSYTTNNVQTPNSGTVFSCWVSNVNGGALSSNAVLTVVPGFPPSVTSQPASLSVASGGTASFSVTASSTSALAFFWRRNGSFIVGATGSTYATNNVQLADSGTTFSCLVSNVFGTTLSSNAVLTVFVGATNDFCSSAIAITGTSYTNTESTSVATSSGDPSPNCINGFGKGVWYVYTAASNGTVIADTTGSGFDTGLGVYAGNCGSLSLITCNDDIGGGNLTSRTTNAVTPGGVYYYLAGGYQGASGNLIFYLNFIPAPVIPAIISQPSSQTAPPGSSVTFSVGASGAAPLNYYWRRNGSTIPGATSSDYTANNVQFADSGSQFSCLVSNAYGNALSANATLTISDNLLQNGGFESGAFSSWAASGNFSSCSVVSFSPFVRGGAYGARLGPTGSQGFLSQSVATIPGAAYLISCWVYNGGSSPNEFSITWNGAALVDQLDINTTGWIPFQQVAGATAASSTLQLGFRNDPSYLGLDDVSVIRIVGPTLQATRQIDGSLMLLWNSLPGFIYQVQSTTDLALPNWTNLGPPISATDTTSSVADSPGTNVQRYYRLILLLQSPVVK